MRAKLYYGGLRAGCIAAHANLSLAVRTRRLRLFSLSRWSLNRAIRCHVRMMALAPGPEPAHQAYLKFTKYALELTAADDLRSREALKFPMLHWAHLREILRRSISVSSTSLRNTGRCWRPGWARQPKAVEPFPEPEC